VRKTEDRTDDAILRALNRLRVIFEGIQTQIELENRHVHLGGASVEVRVDGHGGKSEVGYLIT
jgi:hypothetical protein